MRRSPSMTPGRCLAVPTEKMVSKWPNKISGALGAVSFRSATRTGLAVVDYSRTAVRPWLVKKSSTRVRVASTYVRLETIELSYFNQGEGGVDAGGIEGVGVLVNQGGGQASLSRLVLGGPVLIEVL